MRALIQRTNHACVSVASKKVGEISRGLVVFLGVAAGDSEDDLNWLLQKIIKMRIFPDTEGKMNLSLVDTSGQILLISQFTLLADTSSGHRPSFTPAAKPAEAERLYELGKTLLHDLGVSVACGIFGADMQVELCNDGPVTIWLDSKNR
jgi:D-tyrosyl-tRNA(Tyr) deacylase